MRSSTFIMGCAGSGITGIEKGEAGNHLEQNIGEHGQGELCPILIILKQFSNFMKTFSAHSIVIRKNDGDF